MATRLRASAFKTDRIYKLLFVVVLVVSQFSLVLHQLDIERHADGKHCTICLASQSLDHALAAGFAAPAIEVVTESPAALAAGIPVSRTPLRLVARSPPIPALHA